MKRRELRYRLWCLALWRWRFLAWVAGGIARRLERLHEAMHPERVIAYRCEMCEDREMGVYE